MTSSLQKSCWTECQKRTRKRKNTSEVDSIGSLFGGGGGGGLTCEHYVSVAIGSWDSNKGTTAVLVFRHTTKSLFAQEECMATSLNRGQGSTSDSSEVVRA